MTEHTVATEDEIPEGDCKLVTIDGRTIGIFNIRGEHFAYLNWCAHQAGPICEVMLTGTTQATFDKESLETRIEWVKEGEVLKCPWQKWEFDVITGECRSRRNVSLREYETRVEDGDVISEV
jgi:nitrite reductase/ring-hydroxylating ferredoxin subunit